MEKRFIYLSTEKLRISFADVVNARKNCGNSSSSHCRRSSVLQKNCIWSGFLSPTCAILSATFWMANHRCIICIKFIVAPAFRNISAFLLITGIILQECYCRNYLVWKKVHHSSNVHFLKVCRLDMLLYKEPNGLSSLILLKFAELFDKLSCY